MGNRYFAVHGHFYQPPRQNPFTGEVPHEPGAEPYHDFNEKINAECYRPNAEAGNFKHISFDVGPTLAGWLQRNDQRTYDLIIESDRDHLRRFGMGNAIAQSYNHTILPLASPQEKRIQLAWGIADFEHRFGRRPEGLWLPETAVDSQTLRIMASMGVQFTVLAPWQAAIPVNTNQPYWVELGGGKRIAVFYYNAALSGAVSFEDNATVNAEMFGSEHLARHLNHHEVDALDANEPELILVATDGEVYGHHKPWRDHFLKHLLAHGAHREGYEPIALTRYLQLYPPRRETLIEDDTSWSCHHGIGRWKDSCGCTEGSGTWKWHLRLALGRLAARIDTVYEIESGKVLRDPWSALEGYIRVKLGVVDPQEFLAQHKTKGATREESGRVLRLLEAQFYRQLMFTSCAFFFEDLDRIEPRINIAMAAKAIALIRSGGIINLESFFLDDLGSCISWRTGKTAPEIYREVSPHDQPRKNSGKTRQRLTAA